MLHTPKLQSTLCTLTLICALPALAQAQEQRTQTSSFSLSAAVAAATAAPTETSDQADETTPADGDEGSSWLPWGILGLGAVSLALSAVYLVDMVLLVNPPLETARQNLEAPEISCPSATPSKDCFREEVQLYAQGQGYDLMGVIGHGAIGLTAIVAGVGLLLDEGE